MLALWRHPAGMSVRLKTTASVARSCYFASKSGTAVHGVVENFSPRGEPLIRLSNDDSRLVTLAVGPGGFAGGSPLVRQQQVMLVQQEDGGAWHLEAVSSGQQVDKSRRPVLWNNSMSKGKKGRKGYWDAGRGAWHGPS
mmetsp:Transcript_113355/g.219551  ORF Transcript_113355/g.219551 Transcript_113355/m.219551 type:complete len:139 (+) Transcript_113355:59-475(+)